VVDVKPDPNNPDLLIFYLSDNTTITANMSGAPRRWGHAMPAGAAPPLDAGMGRSLNGLGYAVAHPPCYAPSRPP
jgi:hypothetical protein